MFYFEIELRYVLYNLLNPTWVQNTLSPILLHNLLFCFKNFDYSADIEFAS